MTSDAHGLPGGSGAWSLAGWRLPVLTALAMSVGWGIRGDYGHEAGAMIPGALFGLAVAVGGEREDWWRRAALLGLLGAIGWAFGGQMSYGRVIGYTAHSDPLNIFYGFGGLFVIGALWGGIGAGLFAWGLTRSRSELESWSGPAATVLGVWLVLGWTGVTEKLSARWSWSDTDWVAALSALGVAITGAVLRPRTRAACRVIGGLAAGWLLGVLVLVGWLGLRMTPPRSENWAGALGVLVALVTLLARDRNRAGLLLAWIGLLAGGVGFVFGDFVQMLGRAQWGPIGSLPALQDLDYWKWMEQLFGLVMGAGVGLGVRHLERTGLRAPPEDHPAGAGALRWLAPAFLLGVIPWLNFPRNVRAWTEGGHLREALFGISPGTWCLSLGLGLTAVLGLAIWRAQRRSLPLIPEHPLGRAQGLFLGLLALAVMAAWMQAFPALQRKGGLLVHASFWVTALLVTGLGLTASPHPRPEPKPGLDPSDARWLPWRPMVGWTLFALTIAAVLSVLSWASRTGALPGGQARF